MAPFDVPLGVRLTRRIPAPRERVFDAFTVPELRKRWWGAHPGDHCTLCEIDARVGGRYRINIVTDRGEFITAGTFFEFDRPQRLVFTWSWEVPAGEAEGSVVTIDFASLGASSTELTLTHDRLPTDELRAIHAEGWALGLDNLEAKIGSFPETPRDPSGRPRRGAADHFTCDIRLAAPVHKVYEALTTPQGLKGWWTATAEIGTAIGALSTHHFGNTHNTMRIDQWEPGRAVRWTCVAQDHHAPDALSKTDEWVGTSIEFRLLENEDGGTNLHFEHHGLVPSLECFEICDRGWTHFLGTSLRGLVETGVGQPFAG
jgi:uncharacterized protein YndB with AHSA1/START domain